MDRILTVEDVMSRYKCSHATARKRMKQMRHMEKPLLVTERSLTAWESLKMVSPIDSKGKNKTDQKAVKMSRNGTCKIERISYR